MNLLIRPLAALALACIAPLAVAHAFLDHASPRVGAEVHGSPREVTLSFSADIEAAFSDLRVTDAQGKQVDRGDKRVEGSTLHVSLPPLPPGSYRVYWRVLSVDTHVTEGDFKFQVAP